MKLHHLLAPALVALSLSPLAARQDPKPNAATVPFAMLPSNHMVIEAKLNGKGPYRLIFDLGAPVTLLSNRAAEACGAIKPDAPRSFLMNTRGEGNVDLVKMGDLEAKNVPVVIADHPALKALSGFFSKPIEGIVGYTFWARYRTTIDYKDLKMTFEPVDFQVRNLMKDLPAQITGPKVAKAIVLAPRAVWGLTLGEPVGLSAPGVAVATVLANSAAERAGVKPGDVLQSIDGRWTTSVADTFAAAEAIDAGKAVPVVVRREGQEVSLTVTPAEGF